MGSTGLDDAHFGWWTGADYKDVASWEKKGALAECERVISRR